jgi:hypothetical protein
MNSELNVVLNSSMKTNFDISYRCRIGNQLSDASLNVSIEAISNYKKNSLILSSNEVEFYFLSNIHHSNILDSISLDSIIPHVTKYSTSKFLNSTINLKTNSDLLTNRNVFCKFSSENSTKYSKVEYVSSNNLREFKCVISVEILSNPVEFVDVELIMYGSSNYSFILSSNNETHLFVPNVVEWKTNRVFNPQNLTSILNFNIPSRDFNYRIEVFPDITNVSLNPLDFIFERVNFPNCTFSYNYLNSLKYLPIKLNFALHIVHNKTGASNSTSALYLIYYQSANLEHLKPYVVSALETKYLETKFISNVLNYMLNPYFNYYCTCKSFTI